MGNADPLVAYQRAAARVGAEFEQDMAAAFKDAGAGDSLLDSVGTYIHPSGVVYTGVPGSSRSRAEAHDIEYGTPDLPPRAPVRNTAASKQQEVGAELTKALDEEFGEELAGH